MELALNGITPLDVITLLGFAPLVQSAGVSVNPLQTTAQQQPWNTSTTNPSKKKKKSSGKGKSGGSSGVNPNIVDKQNKSNSSQRKRKNPQQPDIPSKRRKSERDLSDPKDRIVPLSNRAVKEKFALPTLPVRDGSLNQDGKLETAPLGGPYGLAEWILRSMDDDEGRARLLKYGLKNAEQAWCALRVLLCFLGSVSVDDLAYLTRGLTLRQLNDIFTSPLENCRHLPVEVFKTSEEDAQTLIKATKSFRLKMLTPKWSIQHKAYQARVKRTLDALTKKDSMSVTITTEGGDDNDNDVGESDVMDVDGKNS